MVNSFIETSVFFVDNPFIAPPEASETVFHVSLSLSGPVIFNMPP